MSNKLVQASLLLLLITSFTLTSEKKTEEKPSASSSQESSSHDISGSDAFKKAFMANIQSSKEQANHAAGCLSYEHKHKGKEPTWIDFCDCP